MREASFERGVLFRETVTEWVPQRRLSFTIAVDSIPTRTLDQHVTVGGEYFDVLDGTYEIVPLSANEVELRLWSTHRLSTHFNPYASLWTDFVMRQIQGNILEVVRARAEAAHGEAFLRAHGYGLNVAAHNTPLLESGMTPEGRAAPLDELRR